MGHGVKKDYKLAAKFYQLAAMHGISEAQSNLGFLYAIGHGCPKNSASALQHYHVSFFIRALPFLFPPFVCVKQLRRGAKQPSLS
jgi:hypothetical protein